MLFSGTWWFFFKALASYTAWEQGAHTESQGRDGLITDSTAASPFLKFRCALHAGDAGERGDGVGALREGAARVPVARLPCRPRQAG